MNKVLFILTLLVGFQAYCFTLSRIFVFKVEDTAYTFNDIKSYNKAINFLACSMDRARIPTLFKDYVGISASLKNVNSLKTLKKIKTKDYHQITRFFKVLVYSIKQPLNVREKLLSAIKKLGFKNSCKLVDEKILLNIVGLEVFFETRFRIDKSSKQAKGYKAARGLIESIDRQVVVKDFLL